jgi:hypothetical protein
MIKLGKAHKASALALAGVALFGMAMSSNATTVSAQTPPAPPSAFFGDVTLDGAPVATNTLIEAVINGTVCGDARTGDAGTDGPDSYAIQVDAAGPGDEDCGETGDVVSFYIGGVATGQLGGTAPFNSSTATRVDLSFTTPTTAPTTVTTTPGTATATVTNTPDGDDDDDDDDDDNGTATATPKAPTTGSGFTTTDGGSATWLFVALGLGAVALGATGVAASRRS